MTVSNVLGKTCIACGQERRKKDMIAYHPETFEPYCHTPYICNSEHPNSPTNLIKNQMETHLLNYDEAREAYNTWVERTQSNPERIKKIRRMVENPMTIRIGDADLAKFILDLQEEMNFNSISDTIKYCIQNTMDQKGNFVKETVKVEKKITEEKNIKEVETSPIPEPEEPKQEETDEMVFDF